MERLQTKDILRMLRKSKGYTNMKDFCDAAGISIGTYQNYETGKRVPTADMLIKLSDFYGVSTDYLLGRCTNMMTPSKKQQKIAEEYAKLDDAEQKILYDMVEALVKSLKNSKK